MVEVCYVWINHFQKMGEVQKHSHPNWELVYYVKSKGRTSCYLENEQKTYLSDDNTFILFPPNVVHDDKREQMPNQVCIGFHADEGLGGLLEKIANKLLHDFDFSLLKTMDLLKEELDKKTIFYNRALNCLTEEALIYLIRKNEQLLNEPPLQYIVQYFDQYYMTDIRLDEFAKEYGYSPSYFRSIFKQKYGVSPKRYINRVKIEKIKQLLLETTLPLTQIAEDTGFKDYYQFSAFVKKHTHRCPKELRQ